MSIADNFDLPCRLDLDGTVAQWTQRLFRVRELSGQTLVEEYINASAINLDIGSPEEHAICSLNTLVGLGWIEWPYQESKGATADYLFRANYACEQAQVYFSDKWKPCPACSAIDAHVVMHKEKVCLECQECHLKGTIEGWYKQDIKPVVPKRKFGERKPKTIKPSTPATQPKRVAVPTINLGMRPDFSSKPEKTAPQFSLFDMYLEGGE